MNKLNNMLALILHVQSENFNFHCLSLLRHLRNKFISLPYKIQKYQKDQANKGLTFVFL